MRNIKCIFGFHRWFWEDIEFKYGKSFRVWDTLNVKVCTRCGKIKAFVGGKNDYGKFRAINGKQVQQINKTKNYSL